MENGEHEGQVPLSPFEAMKKKFELQQNGENNIVKPPVKAKPGVGKLGGAGDLNKFASNKNEDLPIKPGFNRPGNIVRNKPEPVVCRDTSPNAPPQDGAPRKRSSVSNLLAFQNFENKSLAPQTKPKPKLEPKVKSDANNNADQGEPVSPVTGPKPVISPMKPAKSKPGNTSPRDEPQTSPRSNSDKKSPRGVQVSPFGISPADLKRNLRPTKPNANKPADFPNKVPVNIPRAEGDTSNSAAIELRNKLEKFGGKGSYKRKSVKSVIRSSDNKKFRKVDAKFEDSGEAPAKPEKLEPELDFDNLIEEFQKQLKALESNSNTEGVTEFEEEEEYDDVANVLRPVSVIPTMSEEEELGDLGWSGSGFTGLEEEGEDPLPPPPEELYDDAFTAQVKPEEEEDGELYEALPEEDDLPEPPPHVGPKSPPMDQAPPPVPEPIRKHSEADTPGKTKESKEAERERKKREKEEKERKRKEEQLQKKKEAELNKLLNTYQITAEDIVKSVGKGTIKRSAKESKKSLGVMEGEKVDIIRMVNPKAKGKWLVRLDNTEKVKQGVHMVYSPDELIGYVEADNIEVDTEDIRSLMVNKGGNQASPSSPKPPVTQPDDDGELYEPVDDALPNGVQEFETDEIYEECM